MPCHTGDVGRSHFRIFSDTTFDLLASYALAPSEIPTAVASIKLGGASTKSDTAAAAAAEAAGGSNSSDADAAAVYYAVGTAIIKPNVRSRPAAPIHKPPLARPLPIVAVGYPRPSSPA